MFLIEIVLNITILPILIFIKYPPSTNTHLNVIVIINEINNYTYNNINIILDIGNCNVIDYRDDSNSNIVNVNVIDIDSNDTCNYAVNNNIIH